MIEEHALTTSPYLLLQQENTTGSGGLYWLLDAVTSKFRHVYTLLILKPLARLYISGPSLHGFGFWQNKSPETICAQLSSSDELFWRRNPEECSRIIATHFNGWVILFENLVYLLILYKVLVGGIGVLMKGLRAGCCWVWRRCFGEELSTTNG